jgi:hypothetical protein
MHIPARWLLAITASLLLTSCILTPAKFVSTLDIRADRSFTFTYVGEVQMASRAPDPSEAPTESAGSDATASNAADAGAADSGQIEGAETAAPQAVSTKPDTPEQARELRAAAEALSREYGFRSVRYIGNRKLAIDYAISGRLDHGFVFPFHPDADVMLPFIAIELRGKDRVRIKAPGYAPQEALAGSLGGMGGMAGGMTDPATALDGTFTLTTNAAIVSQNQEEGAQPLPGGLKRIMWKATPQSKDAPTDVLQLTPLP